MKFIPTLVALLIIQVSFSQMKYTEGGNKFDGTYKVASVFGTGTDYPYNDPILVINRFDNGSENFYIGEAGYWQDDTGIKIRFYFDDSDTIYSVYDWSNSSDSKKIFFNSFNDPNIRGGRLSNYEIMDLMRNSSKVTFRIENDYSRNNLVFDLQGSSTAINKVYPDLDKFVQTEKDLRQKARIRQANSEKNRLKLVEKLKANKVTPSDIDGFESRLKTEMSLFRLQLIGSTKKEKVIEDIIIKPRSDGEGNFKGFVDVYLLMADGSERNLISSLSVESDSPIYQNFEQIKKEEAARLQASLEELDPLFRKFKIPRLINAVKTYIQKKADLSYPKWEVSDITDIKATVNRPFRDKIMDVKLVLTIQDEGTKVVVVRVSDLKIMIPELTEAGLEPLVEF